MDWAKAMAKRYPSDLSEAQWGLIEGLPPPPRSTGRPRAVDRRLVVDTILYVVKTGCQWAAVPTDLAKKSTAYDCFRAWQRDGTWQKVLDALRRRVRVAAGRDPSPSKAAIDSQTVKGSEAGGERGYDGGKMITGRKRHLVVDTLGLLLVVAVTAANLDDGTHAHRALGKLTPEHKSRLDEVRGDNKYRNRSLAAWLKKEKAGYAVTVVERPLGAKGLVLLPFRWVAERTNAWVNKCRRNSKDYERTTESSEAMVQLSMVRLMLRRLAPDPAEKVAAFTYPRKPMQKAA